MGLFRRRPGTKIRVEELVSDDQIPHLPASVMAVLKLIRGGQASGAEIATGLMVDPGTSVRVLKLVNSPGFGLRQRVDDLHQAVQLVGHSTLESMLIASAVKDSMKDVQAPGLNQQRFWATAARRAAVAGALAQVSAPGERSLCWTAGLLQDLAVPLILDQLGREYGQVLAEAGESDKPLHVHEKDQFGWTHADVAAQICQLWNFSDKMRDVIATHHDELGEDAAVEHVPVRLVGMLDTQDPREHTEALLDHAEAVIEAERPRLEDAVRQGHDAAPALARLFS